MNRNIPLFIAFRLLFNSRFYYPIFAVIQLDYGLTMAQFAILNAVWAVSIVLLEVPSGALADRLGRKKMVLGAAILMTLEMGIIAFVPLGNASLVFWAWVINRILSGAAEASASGADEALAYDSIPEEDQKKRWPKVLSKLMRLSSIGFVLAMLIGSAVYDPGLINRVLEVIGVEAKLEKETVMRFPVYLTLLNAVACIFVALSMKEPERDSEKDSHSMWSEIFEVGKWIVGKPFVFSLILAALVHDSVVRLFLTSNSEYYRLIDIPVAWFGVIGACSALLGLFVPKIAESLVESCSIEKNYLWVSILTILGLIGITLAIPVWGVLMVIFFRVGFGLLNFFTSQYLNARVDSKRRATLLSFKGLALNVGFGIVSMTYGGVLRLLRDDSSPEAAPPVRGETDPAFRESLFSFPVIFLILLAAFLIYYFTTARKVTPRKIEDMG